MNNLSLETLAPNLTKVWIQGSGWIAFSYKTIIAFAIGGKVTVRENDWNVTTGRHLNEIDGGSNEAKKARLESADFEAELAKHQITFN
tara:strand:+ start:316 stop:579 length:264 start_codon:yes stop_codon:yes gene_type:complete